MNIDQYEYCDSVESTNITQMTGVIYERTKKTLDVLIDLEDHLLGPTPRKDECNQETRCLTDEIKNINTNLVQIENTLKNIISAIK